MGSPQLHRRQAPVAVAPAGLGVDGQVYEPLVYVTISLGFCPVIDSRPTLAGHPVP